MKPITLLPPILALAISIGWIGSGRRSISTIENESALLEKHIAAARSAGNGDDPSHAKTGSEAKAAKGKEPIDWKKLAAQMEEVQRGGGMGDMRTMMRLQQRVQAMSRDEIVAAFDEIAGLGLSEQSRIMLEMMLLGSLAQKDPEFALTKFVDRVGEGRGSMGWALSNAMQEWAKKDPAKALAWFDQQIAAGKFDSKKLDGKSDVRIQFESGLVFTLLSSDPAAAAGRLAEMPVDQRDDVMESFSQQPKEDDQKAFATLVREQLAKDDQAETLARQATRLVENLDYSKVTAYLDRIAATPDERKACVLEAAESGIQQQVHQKPVTRENIETMREWVRSQSPDLTESATGKALGAASNGGGKMTFEEASAMVMEYHQASGSDDLLSSFLENGGAWQYKEQAREIAAKIADAKIREQMLKRFQ